MGCDPPSTIIAVPNVTARPSTASVPITVLLYDGPLLCGFNMVIKELKQLEMKTSLPRQCNTVRTCAVERFIHSSKV